MKRICLTLILLSTLLVGCKPEAEIPTIVTQEVTDVDINTAKVNYEVVNDGGAEVTSRGVCWDTIQNPTIDNDKTNDGTGIGTFTSELSNLISQKTYYVRAYAVNSAGVAYGEEKSFKTLNGNDNGNDNGDDNGNDDNDDEGYVEEYDDLNNLNITIDGVSFKMVFVEGGTFNMGAQSTDPEGLNYDSEAYDREAPVHSVTLSDYYVGETEVTQELWETVMRYNLSHTEGPQKPVEQVTWVECQSFVDGLNEITGKKFRLLTEAEWEFAARGGNKSQAYKYSGSNVLDDVAWYKNNSGNESHDVKTKAPNELGIYDMCGNVLEWCQDLFGNYSANEQIDPTGATSGSDYVIRGGSFLAAESYNRVTLRNFLFSSGVSLGIGFRIALEIED